MPKWVWVSRAGVNYYTVHGITLAHGECNLFGGNAEQVHSWLCAQGFKQVSGRVGVLAGEYSREGVAA